LVKKWKTEKSNYFLLDSVGTSSYI